MKTKYETMKSQTFKTHKIFSFENPSEQDGVPVLVAYQQGSESSHRMAIVNEDGKTIVASVPTLHEFPCIAEFGRLRLIAISSYFSGESMTPEHVYRLEDGKRHMTKAKKKPKTPKKKSEPWHGWFIEECRCDGEDLFTVVVRMRHTDGEFRTIEETLDPPYDYAEVQSCQNYGGVGKNQQAILLTVSDRDGGEADQDIQLEISYERGVFLEESHGEWSPA